MIFAFFFITISILISFFDKIPKQFLYYQRKAYRFQVTKIIFYIRNILHI